MRRLALIPLLVIVFACNDSTLLQPEDEADLQIVAKRSTPKMIPLKGEGTWEWDGSPLVAPSPDCVTAGGTAEGHFTAVLNLTHLGRTSSLTVQCFNFAVSPQFIFTTETFTAANGDQLILYEPGTPLDPMPAGFDWGYPFEVVGGTGRFDGATGEGTAFGTLELTATGARGKVIVEGIISSVGS